MLKIGGRYERGRIITLFGERTGVGAFFGYGGDHTANRKQPAYYPSMLLQLTYYPSRDDKMPRIKEAASLRFHTELVENIWKNAHLNIVFELLILFLHGVTADYQNVYRMTVKWLKLLAELPLAYDLINAYLIKLCYFLGFGLRLEECVSCEEPLLDYPGTVYLKPEEGGFLCPLCQPPTAGDSHIAFSHEELVYLLSMLNRPLDAPAADDHLPGSSRKRLRNILLHYLRQKAEKPLKTLPFLLEIDR